MNKLSFAVVEKQYVRTELKDTFEFRADRKHHWLQRLCLRILKRLGCYAKVSLPTYETRTIDCDRVTEMVRQQAMRLRLNDPRRRPTHVVIGKDAMADLAGEWRDNPACIGPLVTPTAVLGIRIIYVPWHSGVTVLPHDAFREEK